jgi:hypothetical protein
LQAITMPGVQKPHWRASCLQKASCSGCSLSPLDSPSMVLTWRPTASSARVMQLLTSIPSICTLQPLLDKEKNPTLLQIKKGISGNICRCGTYNNIFAAVQAAAKNV